MRFAPFFFFFEFRPESAVLESADFARYDPNWPEFKLRRRESTEKKKKKKWPDAAEREGNGIPCASRRVGRRCDSFDVASVLSNIFPTLSFYYVVLV